MRTAVLATSLTLALTSLVAASPAKHSAKTIKTPAGVTFRHICQNGVCGAFVATDPDGKVHTDAAPAGIGATDLQSAYNVDVTGGSGQIVAVVEGTGYSTVESDLAMYRTQFGLPPCTFANGCLMAINDNGSASPLPNDNDEALIEAALDVEMVSAGCPACKILVVEGGALGNGSINAGQTAAARFGVNAIADSFGGPETGTEVTDSEGNFDNPGTGNFISTGDYGYDMAIEGVAGGSYPATSNHVIAVGGTHLAKVDVSVNPRGWVETAWSQAGSSCSNNIPKPSYQPASAACPMRATSDISGMADPNPGLAIYVGKAGGWTTVGGTSASAPLMAAIFTGAGHSDASAEFVYKHPDIFTDITQGQNGGCGNTMCVAGTGWDGPTGLGVVDQAKLKALVPVAGTGPDIAITFPADGDTVAAGFTIQAMPGSNAKYISIAVDDTRVATQDIAPFMLSAPTTLADGPHTLTVTAFDVDSNTKSATIHITQSSAGGDAGTGGGGGGGCAAGGSTGGAAGVLFALGMVGVRRRKRAA